MSKFTDDPDGPIYELPDEALSDTDAIVRWMDIRSNPLLWKYSDGLSTLITTGKLKASYTSSLRPLTLVAEGLKLKASYTSS